MVSLAGVSSTAAQLLSARTRLLAYFFKSKVPVICNIHITNIFLYDFLLICDQSSLSNMHFSEAWERAYDTNTHCKCRLAARLLSPCLVTCAKPGPVSGVEQQILTPPSWSFLDSDWAGSSFSSSLGELNNCFWTDGSVTCCVRKTPTPYKETYMWKTI